MDRGNENRDFGLTNGARGMAGEERRRFNAGRNV